jgi:ParB-like chromosome segregation protein Spo0J
VMAEGGSHLNDTVPISSIILEGSPRMSGDDRAHISRLAEVDADLLPPILVQRASMRVIDGIHRVRAALLAGRDTIAVTFFDGDDDEAFVRAVQENTAHGLPLRLDERRAAAHRIIRTHPQFSDRAIGRVSGLSDKTVAAIRRSVAESPQPLARLGSDGRVRPSDTTLGRRRAFDAMASRPGASLRDIAREAGISVGTAHDVRKRMLRGEDPVNLQDSRRPPAGDRGPASARKTYQPGDIRRGNLLRSLMRDPKLRHSEDGRMLLRWLQAHVDGIEDWCQFTDIIPAYRAASVAQLAEQCAAAWGEFAQVLSQHNDMTA